MKPLRQFLAAGMLTLGSALAGWGADITHTIQGLQITNHTGYVIDADAGTGNSAYNREHLLAQSRVQTANTSGTAVLLLEYHLRYRLLDSAGQPHPLYDSSGVISANATYNLTNNVGIGAGAAVSRTNVAALRPAARLNPYEQYTVELRVFAPGALREADSFTNSPQTFYHFTNLVSGDAGLNVIAAVNDVGFSRAYAVQTDTDKNTFQADVEYTLRRYDNFSGANAPVDNVPVTLSYELVNATTGVSVPLASTSTNFSHLLFKHLVPPAGPIAPWVLSATRTVTVQPAPGVQLDSVNRQYRLVVTVSHQEQNGVPASEQTGNSLPSPDTRLLHFNGTLRFGAVDTTFTSIDNDPAVVLIAPASHVFTRLGVDNQSGSISGLPGVTYGNGTDLDVRLLANGDATSDDPAPINLPPGGIAEVNNVGMELVAPAVLTPDGLLSSVRVHLPTGMGYRTDTAGHVLRRSFVATSVLLGANLRPVNDVTFTPATSIQVVEETKSLWLETASIVWRVAQGRFDLNTIAAGARHVRSDEYARLEAVHAALDNSQRSLKRSNDRFYQSVQSIASPVVASADSNGVARVSLDLVLGSDDYQTHFPYGAQIQWNGGGVLQIAQDQVVSTNSQLNGAGIVSLSYGTGCTGIDCGDGLNVRTMRLQPADGVLHFTPDGGLVAGGTLDAPHRLQWGSIEPLSAFAHESFNFNDANFHMPGHFLRGDQTAISTVHRASAILYTGVAATNTAYLERPDSPGTVNDSRYQLGFADYAGMNVAVGSDGARDGHSTIAGTPTGNYELKGISKYYARRGGVSGIHDAVFNSFPETLTLYGYQFGFTNFGLNFIDNRMRDSRIDGLIDIPFPSQFVQEFAGLQLNCLGGIEGAPMPEPSPGKSLAYWNGSFDALALQFRRDPEELCNVTNAFLTLGTRTEVAHVTEILYGTLGFQPNGNLLPRAVGPEDIDSRLKLPNVVRIAGPGTNESYVLNPVLDVYFNGYDQVPDGTPGAGWVNIAGSMDVPFFEDLCVHVQTSATGGNSNAPIYMLGGWPTDGWEFDGKNYFTGEYFDDVNRGYANATPTPDEYRNGNSNKYHPRARRTWLGVIDFDYPLNWSSVTRDFRSREPIVRELMVLSTENELKYLSPANAEIAFGAQFDGLPQLNLANIAFQAIDAATAAGNGVVADLLSNAVGGFGRLDEMLSADLDPFFNGIFDEGVQTTIDGFYGRLHQAYTNDPAGWKSEVASIAEDVFMTDGNSISNKLVQLVGTTTIQSGSMLKRLDEYLIQVETAVTNIQMILAENPDGNRTIASQLMQLLVQNVALQFAGGFLDEFVQPILAEADPTLDQIDAVLGNLHAALAQIRETVADPVAGMRGELEGLFAQYRPELDDAIAPMVNSVGEFVNGIDLALDSPVADYTPEEFTQVVRREIEDRFYGTPLAAGIQAVHKHRLYDVDAAIRQATDSVFQELNNVIRSVISETAEELNNSFTKLIAPLDNVAAAAKINGYAHINGDSLKEARVDLHAQLEIGSSLEFNGYLQIKELDSKGTDGCSYAGADSVTEVSLGAVDVQVGWISPELRASVGTKFTFDDGDGFPLRGMGGSFELTGKLEYEAFAINYLGAAIALGQDENYLSAAAGMRLNQYDVFGGIYFGRSCSIEPIRLWDPEAASLLGDGSFTGIYAYGEAWVPINELIGIPASCLFNISAGLGMGAGVFLEGPTFLAKMKAGVSGEALCMVNIKGELVGTGVLEGLDLNVLDGLTVKAKGTVGGKFGPCPFCLELEQSVGLTFKQGKWKLDF